MTSYRPRIAVSAGELSGDEHASRLCQAFADIVGPAEWRGMGGRNMRTAGVDTVVDSEHSASVMGIQEVFSGISGVFESYRTLVRLLDEWRPHALVLVDYPDFNFFVARAARKRGIKTFYYIPPQLWAWRSGRVRTMEKHIDRAAVIFPFERAFYEARGYHRSVYVGHPSVETVSQTITADGRKAFRLKHQLDPDRPLIALFPGSRKAEVVRHTPLLLETFRVLKNLLPELQGAFALADSLPSLPFEEALDPDLHCISGASLDLMKSADVGLLKSGTSNLQAALCNLPFAMFYQAPFVTELIARALIPVHTFSIVNRIKAGSVSEFLQGDANPEALAKECLELMRNDRRRSHAFAALEGVRSELQSFDQLPLFEGCATSSQRTARLLADLIKV